MKRWLSLSLMSVLVLSLCALMPSLVGNRAYAHGPGPAGCSSYYEEPEYPAEITSFIVNNGEQSFDVMADPDTVIPVDVDEGYSIEFVLHTYQYGFHRGSDGDLTYETSSDIQGVTWYYDNTVGYGWGRCVEWVQGDEDKVMSFHYPISQYYGDNTEGTHFIEFMASPYESYENNEPLQSVGFHIWVQDKSTPSDGQSTLAVSTVIVNDESQSYEPLNGYYVELLKDGSVIDAQFSPASFSLDNGELYTIKPYDYGQYEFDYWPGTMSTEREMQVSISTNSGLTAVYRNVNDSPSTPPSEDEEEEDDDSPAPGQSSVTVRTIDSSGNQIYGYYTSLSQGGSVIQTAFSPAEFTVDSGETYQVAVADYGSYSFDHWSDGSTDRFHDVQTGDSLTAVYRP